MRRFLMAVSRMISIPIDVPEASSAVQERCRREVRWAEREEYMDWRNRERLAEFVLLIPLLKMPRVPEWMGPPAKRPALAPVIRKLATIVADAPQATVHHIGGRKAVPK